MQRAGIIPAQKGVWVLPTLPLSPARPEYHGLRAGIVPCETGLLHMYQCFENYPKYTVLNIIICQHDGCDTYEVQLHRKLSSNLFRYIFLKSFAIYRELHLLLIE